jgi:hypothetical protein
VAKLTKTSTRHNAIFPNARNAPLGKTKMQFVEPADKALRAREVSRSMNGSFTPLNEMKSEPQLQQNDQVEDRRKGMAKYGQKWSLML